MLPVTAGCASCGSAYDLAGENRFLGAAYWSSGPVVPLLLIALDESFHPLLPSTVSAPILDPKPGQAAELSLSPDAFFIKSLKHLTSLNQCLSD